MSTQTYNDTLTKNVVTNRNYILRKMGLQFRKPNSSITCKIAFLNKLNELYKELIILSDLEWCSGLELNQKNR